MLKKFNNRPNTLIKGADNILRFESRSVSVVSIPFFRLPGRSNLWTPLGQRSSSTPDHQNKFGLVCGYLDWDESGIDAVIRESWEEIGLDLCKYFPRKDLIQPCYVQSEPLQDDRQNVALRYRFVVEVEQLPELKKTKEVSSVKWLDCLFQVQEDLAFDHSSLLVDAQAAHMATEDRFHSTKTLNHAQTF